MSNLDLDIHAKLQGIHTSPKKTEVDKREYIIDRLRKRRLRLTSALVAIGTMLLSVIALWF